MESLGGPLPPPVVEPSEELGLDERIQDVPGWLSKLWSLLGSLV